MFNVYVCVYVCVRMSIHRYSTNGIQLTLPNNSESSLPVPQFKPYTHYSLPIAFGFSIHFCGLFFFIRFDNFESNYQFLHGFHVRSKPIGGRDGHRSRVYKLKAKKRLKWNVLGQVLDEITTTTTKTRIKKRRKKSPLKTIRRYDIIR